MIFLIQYNRKKGKIIELMRYSSSQRHLAEKRRIDIELSQIQNGNDNEVVILEANNENDLRKTHGRYFENIVKT